LLTSEHAFKPVIKIVVYPHEIRNKTLNLQSIKTFYRYNR
jgi:hypothetical protein